MAQAAYPEGLTMTSPTLIRVESRMDDRPRDVEEWLHKLSPVQQEQAQNLAAVVHAADEAVTEAIKWRRLTFTIGGNWHHWLCAIAITKREASLVFHKGSVLEDPANLLQGESRYLRQIPYHQAAEHPEEVTALVCEAIVHQTEMLDEGL
jgi:hypothetical protein